MFFSRVFFPYKWLVFVCSAENKLFQFTYSQRQNTGRALPILICAAYTGTYNFSTYTAVMVNAVSCPSNIVQDLNVYVLSLCNFTVFIIKLCIDEEKVINPGCQEKMFSQHLGKPKFLQHAREPAALDFVFTYLLLHCSQQLSNNSQYSLVLLIFPYKTSQ